MAYLGKADKEVYFVNTEIKTPPLSREARHEVGVLLRKLQFGLSLSLPHSRPMPSIGKACHELRVNDKNVTWRVMYYIDKEAVVVLEIFSKKTNKTPRKTIALCQKRLQIYKAHQKE